MKMKGSTLRIKILSALAHFRWNMRWITTKTNKGPSFHTKIVFIYKILSHWIGPYRQKNINKNKNLSGTQPKSACGKSISRWLSFSAARNTITKATEYVTPGSTFFILVFFPRKVWTSLSVNDTESSVFQQP